MKNGIRLWLGLAIVPLSLLMFGASPAQANHLPPTHKCDGDPNFPLLNEVFTRDENNPESGRIIVLRNDGQECVISANDIHAELEIEIRVENGGKLSIPNALNIRSLGGNVTLTATGNDIDAPNADIKSDNLIDIQAGVEDGTVLGSIDTKDIISNFRNVSIGDANILIRAQADLSIGKVKTNGDLGIDSQRSGNVQIDANLHPDSNGDISIGAGGSIEEIDIRSLTGGTDQNGLPSPFKVEIGMRVENGSDNSTGSISVSDLSAIKVTQSQSRSGRLELNANKGELILGGGTLDARQTDFGGGNIYLFGEKVTFSGAATIDNSQSDNAPKTARQIIIAASEIDYSAANLNIFSDGRGLSDTAPATVYFLPSGGIISSSTDNVLALEHSVQFNGNFFFFEGEVHFNGGAGSNLNLRADGEHIQIAITGDNIVFDGKDVTVQARGRNNNKHEIVMGFFDFGKYNGTKGLQMNNTGVTLFNVRGLGGPTNTGGDIQIQVDKSELNLGRWNLRAQGGANVGDGGTILYTTSEMIVSPNTLIDFSADAASSGVGNAQILHPTNGRQAILLNAGNSDLTIGKGKGKIQFSADGGGVSGNAGHIIISSNLPITVDNNQSSISAKAPGFSGGDGGKVSIVSPETKFIGHVDNNPKVAIDARGGSISFIPFTGPSGKGGEILITKAISPVAGDALNVNALMKVDPGNAEPTSSFAGSIRLNEVLCTQKRFDSVFSPTWPIFYWDCDGSSSGELLADTVEHLENQIAPFPQLQNYLGDPLFPDKRVQIYSMPTISTFQKYFTGTPNEIKGILGISIPDIRVSAGFDVFFDQSGNRIPIENAQRGGPHMKEGVIVHEIAHQLDNIWQLPTMGFIPDADFIARKELALQLLQADTNCQNAFTALTCAEPAIAGLSNNRERRNALGFSEEAFEIFGYAFEHEQCQRMGISMTATCSDFPDLEKAIGFPGNPPDPGYFDQVNEYVIDKIDNPPPRQN